MNGPSRQPSRSPNLSTNSDLIERARKINTLYAQASTDELKDQLQTRIDAVTASIRTENLRYSVDPYDDVSRFNFSNVDPHLLKHKKIGLLRALYYHLNEEGVDSNIKITKTDYHETKPIAAFIDLINRQARIDSKTLFNAQYIDQHHNKTLQDNWVDGSQVEYDLDELHKFTIKDINHSRTSPGFHPITININGNQPYLDFLIYSFTSLDTINNTVIYIDSDKEVYFVYLDESGMPVKMITDDRADNTFRLSNEHGDDVSDAIRNEFIAQINQGTQESKAAEIANYLNMQDTQRQSVESESESESDLTQPQVITNASGERVLVDPNEVEDNQEDVNQKTTKLTSARIVERIGILKRKEKENPSKLLAILSGIGISKHLILGALAADNNVDDDDLKISVLKVMSAIITITFSKSSLPSVITSGNSETTQNTGPIPEVNEDRERTVEILKFLPSAMSQVDLHRQLATTYNIDYTKKIKGNEAIYLSQNTEITLAKNEEITIFNNLDGGNGNMLSDNDLSVQETDSDKKIKLNKPGFLLTQSLENGELRPNVSFFGHVRYSRKEKFQNFILINN